MLGTIAGVYGQKVISLEECRWLALENNKKLKMADEQINTAKAKEKEAFTKYLPAKACVYMPIYFVIGLGC